MADHDAMRILGAVLLLAAAAAAPAADPEPLALLKRVTSNAIDNDTQLQNYTCVETITRLYYRPAASTLDHPCSWIIAQRDHPTPDMALRLQSMDRLRLDVAVTTHGEMFSWAGASRFDDTNIDSVVREGPIGSGAFGAFLGVIFKTDAKRFLSLGLSQFEGLPLMKYSFTVSLNDSHYKVKLMNRERVSTAYDGLVLVDPATADPTRLFVETAELPAASGSCRTVSNVDYARILIGDRKLLLPSRARQRFISRDGQETENTATFSSCREYSSESTISFYQQTDSAGARWSAAAAVQQVPPDLQFTLQLSAPIDPETAAEGDRFTARLTRDLRDGRHLLAHKGSAVDGRITSMKVYYGAHPQVVLGLSPRHIVAGAVTLSISALPNMHPSRGANNLNRRTVFVLPPQGEYAGMFHRSGLHAVFPKGFASEWITTFPPRSH